jgi:NadR type nicotinamide-nucleotide adenylyltransferase
MLKRIAITGPESTGKSMLAGQLAAHYGTLWVPEYAREYLNGLNRPYEQDDLPKIARGQLDDEDRLARQAGTFLFCDTELLVIKIWSLYKYHRCDPWIVQQLATHPYDLYLLCDIDLPWAEDPLREHPTLRKYFFDWFYRELVQMKAPLRVVSGLGEERLRNAVSIVDGFF